MMSLLFFYVGFVVLSLLLTPFSLGTFCVTSFVYSFLYAFIKSLSLLNFVLITSSLAVLASPFICKFIRIKIFSKILFKILKKSSPTISATEAEAISAGDVWWEADLISGTPDWNKFDAIKYPKLSQFEKDFIRKELDHFCDITPDWISRKHNDIPKESWDILKNSKLIAASIPTEYGGIGFSHYFMHKTIFKLASRTAGGAITTMVPNSLGPSELILNYGTEEQKRYYLPRLADGREIPAFALTSNIAGSDASSIIDYGIVCYQEINGEKVLGVRLNWSKRYITLAPVCTLFGLAVKLYDPDKLLGNKIELGITCILVPASTPNVDIGRRHKTMGAIFQNGPIAGKNIFLPLDNIIGGRNMIGKGWKMLMESLSCGRGISIPSIALGTSKAAFRNTTGYAMLRKQFRTSIFKFEGIGHLLGKMAINVYSMNCFIEFTMAGINKGLSLSVLSAMSKYYNTELCRENIIYAMDIQGGKAIMEGPSNLMSTMYSAIPVMITVEGANIITRCLIIFGQGAIRCHKYSLKEINIANKPISEETTKEFDEVFFAHLRHFISNAARSFAYALTFDKTASYPDSSTSYTRHYYKRLTHISSAYAFLVDASMFMLGGNIKRMELFSARMGDLLSYMIFISTILKRFDSSGTKDIELLIMQTSVEYWFSHIKRTLEEIFDNYKVPGAATIIKAICFPFGIRATNISDKQLLDIGNSVCCDCKLRDILTEGIYDEKEDCSPTSAFYINKGVKQFSKASDIEKIILKNKTKLDPWASLNDLINYSLTAGDISKEEYNFYLEYIEVLNKVISVDEFDKDLNFIKKSI